MTKNKFSIGNFWHRIKKSGIKIAHIINPVEVEKGHPAYLDIAQPVTFKSMLDAKSYAVRKDIQVDLFSVQFNDADASIVPDGFTILPHLEKSIQDFHHFNVKFNPLPRVHDIVQALYQNSKAEYFIYTNVDIGLHKDFYVRIDDLIKEGYDAICVNRRDLPKEVNNIVLTEKNLEYIYKLEGEYHPGWDTFVFKREIVPLMKFNNVFVGFMPVGRVIFNQVKINSRKLKWIEDGVKNKLTFHLGFDAYTHKKNTEKVKHRFDEFHAYNSAQAKGLL